MPTTLSEYGKLVSAMTERLMELNGVTGVHFALVRHDALVYRVDFGAQSLSKTISYLDACYLINAHSLDLVASLLVEDVKRIFHPIEPPTSDTVTPQHPPAAPS